MDDKLRDNALDYHRRPAPGKIRVTPTKPLTTQQDLALAYSPGVAAASEAIHANPLQAAELTARGNLVGVISNGSAVLGLGNIGALAAKPVMEGKGVLFRKFAGIDVFDIEIDESDPERLVEVIAALEPTFGGINLEDIKAPECFEVEARLRERMAIPVFHDDQHGTAIIAAAAVVNALYLTERKLEDVRLVASGAGAAGIACLDLLVSMGLSLDNIVVCDRDGVVHKDRDEAMDERKARYARDTDMRTLAEAIEGAHIFLGVSAPGVLSQDMVKSMAEQPLILALANPVPEIMPDEARAVRPDALIATGRSDFPNQVNNVLGFPYIFRGALDCGAREINEAMKRACTEALAELARRESSDVSAAAYGGTALQFGPDYLIPQPFDPRLLSQLAPAVARAAMDSGVADRPIADLDDYRERLNEFVFQTGLLMRPVFDQARKDPQRVIFAEGEQETVLRAVQTVLDEGLAQPMLIGRPEVVEQRIDKLALRIRAGEDFELINPQSDPRFKRYWQTYHRLMERRGVTPEAAKAIVRTRELVIAALAVYLGDADAMIGGLLGRYQRNLSYIMGVLGRDPEQEVVGALSAMTGESGTYFVCDTHVNPAPDAEQIVMLTEMAAEKVRLFGIEPKVALLSHSAFGSHEDRDAQRMQLALQMLRERRPDLEVEGEMTADAALLPQYREQLFPNSRLTGAANLFVMPGLDAAHIAFNFSRIVNKGVTVGPLLMGVGMPAHLVTPSATVRRLVNMAAIAGVDAQRFRRARQSSLFGDGLEPGEASA